MDFMDFLSYTQSPPIRNGDQSWWVCFLIFPIFIQMVFVSYFSNFLWSQFLNFSLFYGRFLNFSQIFNLFFLILLWSLKKLHIFFFMRKKIPVFQVNLKNFVNKFLTIECFLNFIVSYVWEFNGSLFLMNPNSMGRFL